MELATSAKFKWLAPVMLVCSGGSQYLGAALAVSLFSIAPAVGVAWGRLAVAAVVLLLWRRPVKWLIADRRRLLIVLSLGVSLAAMNLSFYLAISRIALGPAVAIEYVGPIVLAAVLVRSVASRLAIVLATGGVFLITGIGVSGMTVSSSGIGEAGHIHSIGGGTGIFATTPAVGAMWAALAGIGWVGYIIFGRAAASYGGATRGMDLLAGAMCVAAVVCAPAAFYGGYRLFTTPRATLAIVGVGLLSSVMPYVLDQIILRRISAGTFSILTAIFPATSLLVGVAVLSQLPSIAEIWGLALVSGAVVLAHMPNKPQPEAQIDC